MSAEIKMNDNTKAVIRSNHPNRGYAIFLSNGDKLFCNTIEEARAVVEKLSK